MLKQSIKIKMCGMTRQEDIDYAAYLGVDAIGLIFYSGSKRAVSIQQAKQLLIQLPLFMTTVAIVVNPTEAEVNQIIDELPIQWLQFHGRETAAFCNQFKLPYVKAIPAISSTSINEMMAQYKRASAFLLDTPESDHYGGSGMCFDWDIIPKHCQKPVILAGGLTADNVKKAMNFSHLHAVDVCSGIEKSPGVKDHNKMLQFVNAVRGHE